MTKTELFQGDCLEIMQSIPDRSVNMILCDLPYGTTACKWDTVIPFEPLWQQYKRITTPSAAIVLFGAEPFSSMLRISNLKMFKYDWVWKKPRGTGFLNAKKQPMRDCENISVFYKKQCMYNPQFIEGEPYKAKSGAKSVLRESGKTTYGKHYDGKEHRNDNSGFRYPKTIIEFGVVERGNVHPTQKPVALLDYLIRTYTNAGDLVLDNCMGSGSSGVAAVQSGRRFIGIEKDKIYFDIAKRRVEESVPADDHALTRNVNK